MATLESGFHTVAFRPMHTGAVELEIFRKFEPMPYLTLELSIVDAHRLVHELAGAVRTAEEMRQYVGRGGVPRAAAVQHGP